MKMKQAICGLTLSLSLFCVSALPFSLGAISNSGAPETRCGWFVNPTPANAWLIDADGEWTISVQGGYQAEGDWPNFTKSQWIKTNVNYGYGCACMKVTVNKADDKILRIISSFAKPISACRKDKALKGSEPGD